ncbi:protein PHYTOCHROME-DEPENDENT LATE-FLOWERING-like isoform X2 [Pyrus x bretschneideri]|uniref:protein PHYTOCHROME-DEPENDENT LATE-FLOWERING-like isoform X2 n=1 Tax=Pyrus x bretschneideri TaxID=225117 RepID=UPI0020307864|nr:protein PHYTOCHROME-DEPENDENT LATE-FLOWERING-like isoform X2 [Pyrus x bretschneideri]
MGVSFQVAKTGTRYRPKLLPTEEKDSSENDSGSDPQQRENEVNCTGMGAKVAAADPSSVLVNPQNHSVSEDFEVCFSLKLFENGFNVGKANELLNGVPEHLHPYDRASEKLFTAIECGWLPGAVFDALPCKYVNGAILCEIQDYRSCLIQERATVPINKVPSVHKVLLHMRTENVVKDILSISNNSWTYRDFLEVESQIVKALQPALHLNPQPLQDIYSGESLRKKIDLGIVWSWKRRKLSDASDTDIGFNNCHRVADITVNCATQSCSSLAGLSYQERGITFSEHNVVRENLLSTRKQPSSRELGSSLSDLLTSQASI